MDIKQKVLEKYDIDKKWMQDAVIDNEFSTKIKTYFVKHLESVEKFMMSEDYSAEWLPEFVRITKKLDEIRKQDITQVVPELKSLFE